jgi:hypothetical protein
MMALFGKPVAEPSSDAIQARRAMAIGSSIFDFSTSRVFVSFASLVGWFSGEPRLNISGSSDLQDP